jgi:hypothetical protein
MAFYGFLGFVECVLRPFRAYASLFELLPFQLACSGYGLAVRRFGSAALVHQSAPFCATHGR